MKLLKKAFDARMLFKTTRKLFGEYTIEPNGVNLKPDTNGEYVSTDNYY